MQPSEIKLRAAKGVITDFANEDVAEGFAIKSINGRFLPSKDGQSFNWSGVRGEKIVPITGDWLSTYVFNKCEVFQGNVIAFVTSTITTETMIIKLVPVYSSDKSIGSFTATKLVSDPYNAYLQLSVLNPVSKVRIVYETGTIYTIYWNNRANDAIKSIRIINDSGNDELTNVNFSQYIKYGTISLNGLVNGALLGGAMFYSYRLLGKNGSVTDWSMAMGPIMIPNRLAASVPSWSDYTSIRYANADEKSACGVSLTISGVDISFYKIQLAAIVSNENSTFERAYICIEQKIDDQETIVLNHLSDASFGIIAKEEIQISTQALLGCADFDIINNIMVVIGPRIDDVLVEDETAITYNKVIGATILGKSHMLDFDANSVSETDPPNTDPPLGCLSTSQFIQPQLYWNRLTAAYELKTETIPAGYVGYKDPIIATLFRNLWRNETYRIGCVPVSNYGKRLGTRWIGDFVMPKRGGGPTSATTDIDSNDIVRLIEEDNYRYKMQVVSLIINSIDITQWVHTDNNGNPISCDIQGFHIVVSPRDPQTVHEGALFAAANHMTINSEMMYDYGLVLGNAFAATSADNPSNPINRLYQYYSPDVQNNSVIPAETGSFLQIEEQHKGQFTALLPNAAASWYGYTAHSVATPYPGAIDGFSAFHYSYNGSLSNSERKGVRLWNKYFKYLASADTLAWTRARNPVSRQTNEIKEYYDLPMFNAAMDHDLQAIFIEDLGHRKFINAYWGATFQTSPSSLNHDSFGAGAASRLIVTKTEEDANYSMNPYATVFANGITVVSTKRNSANLYGGTSDSALETSIYRSCWHYQPIDNTILANIKTPANKFVFDGIEVFAGDSYIVPYSLNRLSHAINYGRPDHVIADPENEFYPTMAFMVPLQSNINWTMHSGNTWEENRGLKLYYNDSNLVDFYKGIGVMMVSDSSPYALMENSEFPSLAQVIYGQNLYYALPESIFYTNEYPMRYFWSNRKIDAEEIDNFRIFPFENYGSIPGELGLPVAIRSASDNAIIFTQEAVGAIPIDERASVTDESGKQLSIGRNTGVGRFAEIDREHGLRHFFSLSQKGNNFTWFDFKNRDWIYWGKGQQLTNLSEKYKFNSDFLSIFSDINLFNEDLTEIRTMFADNKEIMFYKPGARALVFDTDNNIYQGRRDIIIHDNFLLNSLPIVTSAGTIYITGYGTYSKSNEQYIEVSLTLVANKDSDSYKIFDSFRLKGSNIKEILLTNHKDDSDTSLIKILGLDKLLHKYTIVEFLNDLYVGEIPLTQDYDFLRGFYVTVKITGFPDDSVPVKFNNLILNVRKDFD